MTSNKITFSGINRENQSFDRVKDSRGNELFIDDKNKKVELTCGNDTKELGFIDAINFRLSADHIYSAHQEILNRKGNHSTTADFDLGDFPSPLQQFCDKDRTPQK